MKQFSIIILFVLSFVFSTEAQQRNPAVTDTTTVRFVVKFNPTAPATVKNSTTYEVTGNVDDPVDRPTPYNNNNVSVGDFFVDGRGTIYRISAISLPKFPLKFEATVLSGTASIENAPPTSSGLIYQPTPNLLLPQWVTSMSSTVQGALLSHMANMIDLTLSQVATENFAIKTTDYTLNSTDDTILFDVRAGDVTLTLPPASSSTGKSFKIGKIDESDKKVNFSPALVVTRDVLNGNNLIIPSLNYPRTFLVQSDGTNWWVINQN